MHYWPELPVVKKIIALITITNAKKPSAIIVVHLDKNASMVRPLFLDKNVSEEEPPPTHLHSVADLPEEEPRR